MLSYNDDDTKTAPQTILEIVTGAESKAHPLVVALIALSFSEEVGVAARAAHAVKVAAAKSKAEAAAAAQDWPKALKLYKEALMLDPLNQELKRLHKESPLYKEATPLPTCLVAVVFSAPRVTEDETHSAPTKYLLL